jgi:hypothetical protein
MRVPLPAAITTIWSDMQASSVKRWIIAVAVIAAAALAGCSMALKFSYGHASTLISLWMGRYVDFSDAQKPRVQQGIDQWLRWNRKEQLPDYAQLLERYAQQLAQPRVPAEAFCGAADEVKQRLRVAWNRAQPSVAELAVTITPEQAAQMEKRFEKNNDKFRDEFIDGTREERVHAHAKKAISNFELVYGRLDSAQRARVEQLEAASPYDPEQWLAEHRALQQEALRDLADLNAARRAGASQPQLVAQAGRALQTLADHVEHSPRDAYAVQAQRVWNYNCVLAAQMHATMSAEQRQHAQAKLRDWEKDVRELMAEAPR